MHVADGRHGVSRLFLASSDMGRSHLTTLFRVRHCIISTVAFLCILLYLHFWFPLEDFGQKHEHGVFGFDDCRRRDETLMGKGGRMNGKFLVVLWKEGKKGRTTFLRHCYYYKGCRLRLFNGLVGRFGCFASALVRLGGFGGLELIN
jgi:hypothetical protein